MFGEQIVQGIFGGKLHRGLSSVMSRELFGENAHGYVHIHLPDYKSVCSGYDWCHPG